MNRPAGNTSRTRGAALAVGLVLLTLVTLLGLAGASVAHVERVLAQNEVFRENAAAAASAGIEMAMREISSSDPATVPGRVEGLVPGTNNRFEVTIRLAGFETSLPQAPGARFSGAHFEIFSAGYGPRHAVDRQRASVMRVVHDATATPLDCEPVVPRHCHADGEVERLSWQRVTGE